ncbi:MAG: hypothetical protein ACYC8T_17275 [Myxococcaceae bacterium]
MFDAGSPDGGASDGGPGPGCQSNLDCLMGQVCYSGVCQVIPCDVVRPCPGALTCVSGYCE